MILSGARGFFADFNLLRVSSIDLRVTVSFTYTHFYIRAIKISSKCSGDRVCLLKGEIKLWSLHSLKKKVFSRGFGELTFFFRVTMLLNTDNDDTKKHQGQESWRKKWELGKNPESMIRDNRTLFQHAIYFLRGEILMRLSNIYINGSFA